jgi:acyl-CoA dehydrogenase
MLGKSATELFAGEVTPESLESADRGEWPAKLWATLDTAGYPRLFAEDDPDLTWADAHPLILAAGTALAPVPLPEMLLASWLLRLVGIAVPDGITTCVPQCVAGEWHAEGREGDWHVTGQAPGVPWVAAATHVVVVVETSGQSALALISTSELEVTPDRNAANEPRDAIVASAAKAVALATLGTLPPDILQRFGAMIRATQMAGAMTRMLALTADYAGEREQFGRPIAKFQAISQQLAVFAEESLAAGTAAAYAWADGANAPASRAIPIAKIRAGQAAGVTANIAHAVFGAIGITAEHSLHFATRRLWSWRAEFGAEVFWARELGRSVLTQGGACLWPSVTGGVE